MRACQWGVQWGASAGATACDGVCQWQTGGGHRCAGSGFLWQQSESWEQASALAAVAVGGKNPFFQLIFTKGRSSTSGKIGKMGL